MAMAFVDIVVNDGIERHSTASKRSRTMPAERVGQRFACSTPNRRRRRMRRATATNCLTIGLALSAGVCPSQYQRHTTPFVAASPSRAYPHGCSSHPPSYYDYDSMQFPPPHRPDLVRRADEFGLTRRLGAGKFSDVFEAVDVIEEERLRKEKKRRDSFEYGAARDDESKEDVIDPRTLVVIKCLKPVSDRKVRRELLVLTHASSLPNLARLRGIVVPETKSDSYGKSDSSSTNSTPADELRGGGGRTATATASVSSRARSAATMPSLILEHAGRQSRWLCHGRGTDSRPQQQQIVAGKRSPVVDDEDELYLSEYEIKYYLFHLLVALDALHSRGIMHRDVKPRNTLINRSATYPYRGSAFSSSSADDGTCIGATKTEVPREGNSLMLVDLGLADFYLPGRRYNVRVASRHYKAPELLVGNELYDYAVDLWGVGCILAGLLFRREPFFRGRDNVDQLGKIVAVLGPNDLLNYCDRVGIELTPELDAAVSKYMAKSGGDGTRRAWRDFVGGTCPMPADNALDLLDRLLVYDHSQRFTAREAMAHPFFDDVRARVKDEIRLRSRNRHASGSMTHMASFVRGDWRTYIQTYQST